MSSIRQSTGKLLYAKDYLCLELLMKTCLYYWPIEPLSQTFLDDSNSVPIFEIPIDTQDRLCTLALFTGNVANVTVPQYARLEIPRLSETKIPDEILPFIQTVKEHFLSTLRLTYHADVSFFPRPIWTFVEEDTPHSIGLEFSEIAGDLFFDSDRAKRIFVGSFPHREEVRLLIDGSDNHIPIQYRYLSLYKILELNYKISNRWREQELESLLEPYEIAFKQSGFLKKPINLIHELRDQCAHIKTGKDVIGVTQLNH